MIINLNLTLLVFTVIVRLGSMQDDCTDSLTKKNFVKVTDTNGKEFKMTNCKKLFKKFPGACESVGGPGEKCCASCGDPTCLDKVTKSNPLIGTNNLKVTSCSIVAKRYKVLCRDHGRRGGSCCRSCKDIDTKCVDNIITFMADDRNLNCAKFIKADPCRCADRQNKKDCCESCQDVDTVALQCSCRDTLSKANAFTVNIGKEKLSIDNCQEVLSYFPGFCRTLGRKGDRCCNSCKGVDMNCVDSLSWRATVGKGRKLCENCSCHEIRRKSATLMMEACTNDIQGSNSFETITNACCLQCKRVQA